MPDPAKPGVGTPGTPPLGVDPYIWYLQQAQQQQRQQPSAPLVPAPSAPASPPQPPAPSPPPASALPAAAGATPYLLGETLAPGQTIIIGPGNMPMVVAPGAVAPPSPAPAAALPPISTPAEIVTSLVSQGIYPTKGAVEAAKVAESQKVRPFTPSTTDKYATSIQEALQMSGPELDTLVQEFKANPYDVKWAGYDVNALILAGGIRGTFDINKWDQMIDANFTRLQNGQYVHNDVVVQAKQLGESAYETLMTGADAYKAFLNRVVNRYKVKGGYDVALAMREIGDQKATLLFGEDAVRAVSTAMGTQLVAQATAATAVRTIARNLGIAGDPREATQAQVEKLLTVGNVSDFYAKGTQKVNPQSLVSIGVPYDVVVAAVNHIYDQYNGATEAQKYAMLTNPYSVMYDKDFTAQVAAQDAKRLQTLSWLENRGYKVGENQYNIAGYVAHHRGHDEHGMKMVDDQLRDAGFTEKQITQAHNDAEVIWAATPLPVIRPGEHLNPTSEWLNRRAYEMRTWLMEFQSHMGETQAESWIGRAFETTAQGVIGGAAMLVLGGPLIVAQVGAHPSQTPTILWGAAKSMANQVGTTFGKLFMTPTGGGYAIDIVMGNLAPLASDSLVTAAILYPVVKGVVPLIGRVTTYLAPRGVPLSVIAKEASTGRIPTPEDFATQYAEAMRTALTTAMERGGEFTAEVPITGTPFKLRVLTSPLQHVVGDVLFHMTKDEVGPTGLIKESLLSVAEREGRVNVGAEGLYTDPWAAIQYTRGGQNPGILMVLTDATKVRSGAQGLAEGLTKSDKFIRGASEGLYGPSKVWRGDLETELVYSPGSKLAVPDPTATLITRVLAGKYSDFFTYDSGKFVPIKIALDKVAFKPEVLAALKQPITLYGIKLWTLKNALRDTEQAIKHPDLMLKDLWEILKETVNPTRLLEEGATKGERITFLGVRDVYLIRDWGSSIGEVMRSLYNRAFKRTKEKLGERESELSAAFKREFERNMEESYKATADSLLREAGAVSAGYAASAAVKSKFEESYLTHLSIALSAIAKSLSMASTSRAIVVSDAPRSLPSRESMLQSLQSEVLPSRGREAPSRAASEVLTPSSLPPGEGVSRPPIESPATTPPPEVRSLTESTTYLPSEQSLRRRDDLTLRDDLVRRDELIRRDDLIRRDGRLLREERLLLDDLQRRGLMSGTRTKDDWKEAFRGSVGWKQGVVIWALKYPFQTKEDIHPFYYKNPPLDFKLVPGGPKSAYASIQKMYPGVVPSLRTIKVGFQLVTLRDVMTETPGASGAISFERADGAVADIDVKGTGQTKQGSFRDATTSFRQTLGRATMSAKPSAEAATAEVAEAKEVAPPGYFRKKPVQEKIAWATDRYRRMISKKQEQDVVQFIFGTSKRTVKPKPEKEPRSQITELK